jgi:hypothetical protein
VTVAAMTRWVLACLLSLLLIVEQGDQMSLWKKSPNTFFCRI